MAAKKTGKALAIPVPGPGRKSLYREEFADQARKLCLLGATDKEIAEFFEVAESTINNWKLEHPAFLESIRAGKVKADADVAESLFKRATGEFVQVEKLVKTDKGFEAMRIKQFIPGDPQAAFRWLMNRRRQDWTDKQVFEHTGANGGPIQHETVQADADAFTSRVAGLAAGSTAGSRARETKH
jgi:hypothetical protein